jgi:TatD DNase family protein
MKQSISKELNSDCCEMVPSPSTYLQPLALYKMSLKVIDLLGPKSLFDSHCHMDFIFYLRLSHLKLNSFDQFVQSYPLMKHSCLEGFITNFCSPKLWVEHLASPTPLISSLLLQPSVYYTIGCHPHYARELLVSGNFPLLEQLLENAGQRCVAVGECGLDTSSKNTIRMADQVAVFKMQVKLAIRLNKPLVLHIRGAESEAISALEEVKLPANWPIHRYEFKIFLSNDIYK